MIDVTPLTQQAADPVAEDVEAMEEFEDVSLGDVRTQ